MNISADSLNTKTPLDSKQIEAISNIIYKHVKDNNLSTSNFGAIQADIKNEYKAYENNSSHDSTQVERDLINKLELHTLTKNEADMYEKYGTIRFDTNTTSVSGTTGEGSSDFGIGSKSSLSTMVTNTGNADATATLKVDSNANGRYDDSDDLRYSVAVTKGSFSFNDISLGNRHETKALLTVEKEGYPPYTKVLTLKKDNALSVLAKIGSKPVLTEVIDLSKLSSADRASSFVKFGVREGANGVESFSKLMSLSEFKAEADLNLSQDGTMSESLIPTGAFPSNVQTVTAKMQSFDSSNPDDFTYFPGALSGHGKPGLTATATGNQEVALESAGFDMMKLTDQNGDHIDLQSVKTSKLSAMTGTAVCGGMLWTRYLHSGEVGIIKGWGDDDNDSSNGYQVPIWSNDNATGSWQYVGLADVYDLNGSNPYFKACVDTKWQGYLNCDSPLATTRPKQICISAHDQLGDAIGGFYVNGKKGGSYSSAYLSSYGTTKGTGIIEVKDGNITGWAYKYRSALTGWSNIDIDPSSIVQDTTNADCDYDMNISIENPYTSVVHVKAYAIDDVNYSTPLTNVGVRLYNGDYKNYYNKYAYTDAKGIATFKIKPNVQYKVTYKAGEANVTADGSVVAPETNDTTRDVYVNVKDINKAPRVYVRTYSYNITDKTKTMRFYVSASDANNDPLTFNGLTLDKTPLVEGQDYNVTYKYSYDGSYYMRGVLDLQSPTLKGIAPSLAAKTGYYTLKASVTDSKLPVSSDSNFQVRKNQAPTIGSLYLRTNNRTYYQTSRNIPDGNFTISVNIYDGDGDNFNKTIQVDGADYNNSVAFTKGNHTITVTATDENNNTSNKSFTIYTGNHAPVISSAGATTYFASQGTKFKLYAYVNDAEYDALNVTATDESNNTYTLSKVYGNSYRSDSITMGTSDKSFEIIANDGEDNSSKVDVNVTFNNPPTIKKAVAAVSLFTGDSHTFTCSATDPEGTAVFYDWRINNNLVTYKSYTGSFTKVFTSAGDYNITCTAYDRDYNTAQSSAIAHVRVNQAPVFDTNLSNVQLYSGTTKTFTCSASDPEGGAVNYVWRLNNQIQTATGTTFSHTFSSTGVYSLSCTASDPRGLSNKTSAQVRVVENHVPVFDTKFSNVTLDLNEAHTFSCTASDPEGTQVTYAWSLDSNILNGETATSYTVSFPQEGSHTLACIATDADGKSAKNSALVTVKKDMPPVFTVPLKDITVDVNKSHTFSCTAQDPEGTALTYAWKLDGLDTNSTTTSLSETFTATGTHTISCTATDAKGKSTTSSATITVIRENKAPVFTTPLTGSTININTEHTFTCVASDPEGTSITYSWSLDGQTLSETTGSYTTTFTTTGTKHISCTATDADGKTATSTATVLVIDPTKSGTLTIHTGLANMKAVLHDSATLKPITEKTTDANGDVSFSVTGDRATFSLTVWSGMEIDQAVLMKLVKEDYLPQAYNACENNSSVASECSSADWCTMATSDTIDDWVWDIAASNDDENTTPPSNQVDSDNDGKVSASELYTAALTVLDKNDDGKITYDEFNGDDKAISTQMFVQVPVREYYIPASSMNNIYYYSECRDATSFDTNLTLHTDDSNTTLYGSTSGSGYGSIYGAQPDQNGNVNIPLRIYNSADDGTYSLLVRGRTANDQNDYFYFLQDKTKENLENGITLNTNEFQPADKNVTFKTHNSSDVDYSDLYINATYKGLWFDASSYYAQSDENTSIESFYTNKNFTYRLSGYKDISSNYTHTYQEHDNYYGDGTLKDSYDSADYPMLDANVVFDKDGRWTLSGSELAKVNDVSNYFDYGINDENGSYNLNFEIDWTVAPTQSPDLNITAMLPSDLQQTAQEILSKTNPDYTSTDVDVEEYKGLSESQFLDIVAGSASGAENSDYDDDYDLYMKYGNRYNDSWYDPSTTSAGALSASSAQNTMKKHRAKKPFTVHFDVSKLFSK